MPVKRVLFAVLIISIAMLAMGTVARFADTVQARPLAQQSDPAGVTIPYPGRLTDDAGQPVTDGAYDFTFTLYNTEIGGEPLWSEVQKQVMVQDGSFHTSLGSVNPLPTTVLGDESWLVVALRGPGETEFTALTPRQHLSAASPSAPSSPTNGAACPHDHFGESWGGASSDHALYLSQSGSGDGFYVAQYAASGRAGFFGINDSSGTNPASALEATTNSTGPGVKGTSTSGNGVEGYTSLDSKYGVYGKNNNTTTTGVGVLGYALAPNGTGVYGEGAGYGVYSQGNMRVTGNTHVDGDLSASGAKSAVVQTQDYGQRRLYAMESPGLWFEDFGNAQLADGQVVVPFEPIFAQTVNLAEPYHVFLTPLGDCPLYVVEKTPTSFTVRAMEGKTCAIAFDYRIVAKRLGYEQVRLALDVPSLSLKVGDLP